MREKDKNNSQSHPHELVEAMLVGFDFNGDILFATYIEKGAFLIGLLIMRARIVRFSTD